MNEYPPPPMHLPLVSVIIPMYNVEKYIAETLGSLLGQTLRNFEVIVVNNGSTDNSLAISERYVPKFEGRLKILNIAVNTGGPSIPRNKGLEFSRGKYIYFMDSDDVVSNEALNIFYQTAEKYHSDAVFGKNCFVSKGVGENFLKQAVFKGDAKDRTLKMITEDIAMRIKLWSQNYFTVVPWLKFLRRDFLLENEIKFLNIMQEDSIWSLEIIFLAKNLVIVPQAFYLVRRLENSLSTRALNANFDFDGIFSKVDRLINGLKHLDEFMGKIEFFQKNPEYRYTVVDLVVVQNLDWLMRVYGNIPQQQFYEKLREVLAKDTGNFDILISCIINSWIRLAKNSKGQ